MPFGYKNGPSIFQHIMQALFSWIFVLVYINDIIIFSLTFEDYISHLNQVFQVIEQSGVTLAITKCHFRYQSLLLLGQKVRGINTQIKGRCCATTRRAKELSSSSGFPRHDGLFFRVCISSGQNINIIYAFIHVNK
jgi:hypothetical protein